MRALGQRDELVVVAVHDQKGRGILVHVGQGIGGPGEIALGLHRAAEEQRFGGRGASCWIMLRGPACWAMSQVGRAEPIHDRLHATGDVAVAQVALHFFRIAAGADKRGEMSAGGSRRPLRSDRGRTCTWRRWRGESGRLPCSRGPVPARRRPRKSGTECWQRQSPCSPGKARADWPGCRPSRPRRESRSKAATAYRRAAREGKGPGPDCGGPSRRRGCSARP